MSSSSDRRRRLQELLVTARHDAGLTQAEVAARLAQPQSYVHKYETGKRRITLIEFLDICAVLGVDGAALLRGLSSTTGKAGGEPEE
jgi:transcriptional regulator with XRE-family HTH domain